MATQLVNDAHRHLGKMPAFPFYGGPPANPDMLARATVPERVYRHQWQVGDLVLWDNRGVLHRACRYDPSSPRDMHRTTFSGDEPIQ